MNKNFLKKISVPILSIVWLILLCTYGWWVLLWSIVGMAIGVIIKQLKENV